MNVSCGNCPAKYAVPDQKVRGRKVRIKCKHCGAAIVVDGTQLAAEMQKSVPGTASPAAVPRPAEKQKPGAQKPAATKTEPDKAKADKAKADKAQTDKAKVETKTDKAQTDKAKVETKTDKAKFEAKTDKAKFDKAKTEAKFDKAKTEAKTDKAKTAASPPATATEHEKPAAVVAKAPRSAAKQTMLGVPLPAVGAAPAPPAATTSTSRTPKPRPASAPDGESANAEPAPRRARSAAKRTIIGGLEAAPGSTPFVDRAHGDKPSGVVVPRPDVEPVSEPAPMSAPEPEWTVAITDEQHEDMDTHEVVALYASGTINEETFIWKDGMEDWATPFEIPKIASALETRGLRPGEAEEDDDAATLIGRSPLQGGGVWREPGSWNEPPVAPGADIDDVGFDDVTVSMAAPRAAELLRAAEAREAARHSVPTKPPPPMAATDSELADAVPDDDEVTVSTSSPLFSAEGALLGRPLAPRPAAGAPPERSSEQTPSTAASKGASTASDEAAALGASPDEVAPPPHPESGEPATDGRPTGARNESSVLFSLNALGEKETRAPQESSEELFGMPAEPAPTEQEQASALAAPDFSAPPIEATAPPSAPAAEVQAQAPEQDVAESPPSGGSGVLWVLVVLVLLGGAGFASYHFRYPAQLWSALLPALGQRTTPTPTPAPATTTSATAQTAPATGTETAPGGDAAAPAAGTSAAAGAHTAGNPNTTPRRWHGVAPAGATSAGASPSAGPSGTVSAAPPYPPFNRHAATGALAGVAASLKSCKQHGTPRGTGQVSVTFMPSGRATNAIVTGDFAGTAVGGCVARLFRGTRVPPFSGSPVTVHKSFAIH